MNYCSKCKANLSGQQFLKVGNDYYCVGCLKCSFCQKSLTSGGFSSRPDKPGVIACEDCKPQLMTPVGYDPNAKATCKCGKTSRSAWEWNGNTWNHHVRILDADCCSMLHNKCKCGAEKNKKELQCKKCIEREREREREREQKWQGFWQTARFQRKLSPM